MNNQTITRQGGILAIFFFIFIILTSSAFAWDEYNQGLDRNAVYDDNTAEFSTTNIYTSISDGSSFQPLIKDIDGDGVIEVVGSDSTYLKVWKLSGGVLVLDNEYQFADTQKAQMVFIPNTDGDNYTEILYPHGHNNLTIIEYNSTDFVITRSFISAGNVTTAPTCFNTSHSSQVVCVWGDRQGNISETTWNGTEFPDHTNYNLSNVDIFTTTRGLVHPPVVDDIDNDGNDEMLFICDYDNDGNEGVCSIKINTISSIDDYVDSFSGNVDIVAGIVTYNLDDAGHKEVIITQYASGGIFSAQDSYMRVYKSDLSTNFFSKTLIDEGSSNVFTIPSNPVIADFIDTTTDDNEDICVIIQEVNSGGDDTTNIQCYDDDGDKVFDYSTTGTNYHVLYFNGANIGGADLLDDDNSKYELVTGGAILTLNNGLLSDTISEEINYTTASTTTSPSYIAINEFQSDLSADVCGMAGGLVWCSYMEITNAVPTLTEFNINTGNPVCLNEVVTISASEGDDYTNDLTIDTERISVAFPNGTTQYGSYDTTNPSIALSFKTAGTYDVTIYLNDLANSGDTSVYSSYSFIASSNNLTCKSSGEGSTTSSSTGSVATSDNDVSNLICDVFEGFNLTCGGSGTTIIWLIGLNLAFAWAMISMRIHQLFPHVIIQAILILIGTLVGAVAPEVGFLIGFIVAGLGIMAVMDSRSNGGS